MYPLTVIKQGDASNEVTSAPGGIDCGSQCAAEFPKGNVVLVASPAAGQKFAGWSGGCTGAGLTCEVALAGPTEVTATFVAESADMSPPMYQLTVIKQGDASNVVTSAPGGIDCGPQCDAEFPKGSVVLAAASAQGQTFVGWSGGGCSGNGPTCEVALAGPTEVTAKFQGVSPPPPMYPVAVSKAGHGNGTVMSTPGGIVCGTNCSGSFPQGQMILTAQPSPGSAFSGWSGACTGTAPTCTLNVNSALAVTANFAASCASGLSGKIPIAQGWAIFYLPNGQPGEVVLYEGGHYCWGFPCHTIWWTNFDFVCQDGQWVNTSLNPTSDGYCNTSWWNSAQVYQVAGG